jgi:hypothetical protein
VDREAIARGERRRRIEEALGDERGREEALVGQLAEVVTEGEGNRIDEQAFARMDPEGVALVRVALEEPSAYDVDEEHADFLARRSTPEPAAPVSSSPVDLPVLRSLLFAPASDEHKLRKALASGADGVVADLEDATAPTRRRPRARSCRRSSRKLRHGPRADCGSTRPAPSGSRATSSSPIVSTGGLARGSRDRCRTPFNEAVTALVKAREAGALRCPGSAGD